MLSTLFVVSTVVQNGVSKICRCRRSNTCSFRTAYLGSIGAMGHNQLEISRVCFTCSPIELEMFDQ